MEYAFDNTSVTDISNYFVKVSQTEGIVTLVILMIISPRHISQMDLLKFLLI